MNDEEERRRPGGVRERAAIAAEQHQSSAEKRAARDCDWWQRSIVRGMIGEPEEQDHLRTCTLCRDDQEGARTGRSHCRVSREKIHARSPTAKKEKREEKIEDLRTGSFNGAISSQLQNNSRTEIHFHNKTDKYEVESYDFC
ncbi:UNVERIFIED_CONTAM: hypothetical protein K2H54_070093 [Gekko kuhli]